ncbi:DUF6766 family protein [Nonomuraea roseoviolacea]|uniref:Membrane protein implicated in regulation of membrane protease activity n=1 Tax=Nonomuraea roseoviolacea subsp. carminata TaxID=160689 RepID=A0ABT1JSM0_9ACTN|nr:DUF6766 family protein [Nonomuraea roseoviolacea]MCP2344748.1 membrane protein implicated in regulation of membrane protease activity [Nonomuraea roseoviolacea subsp. carminata]
MRWIKENALSVAFLVMFLLALAGQAWSGAIHYNEEQLVNGLQPVSVWAYVTSSSFAVDVAENWQSEYLQFLLFIVLTVWLVQKGSPESKKPGEEGPEADHEQLIGEHAEKDSPRWARVRGARLWMYSNSLGLVMGTIFVLSWLAQSVAGLAAYNSERITDLRDPVDWGWYVTSSEFWNRSLQNWQSELLAVLSMVVLSIYLRQRGSPESKPVGAPHHATSVEG